MALTTKAIGGNLNKELAAAAVAKAAKTRKPAANAELVEKGKEIIATMNPEERAKLGSMSSTLHFVHLLGLGSKKGTRRISQTENEVCSTPVGVTLRSDVDIKVPVIDINKNAVTGIDPEKDITYREVKAGEEFDLTYYEFMFLIIRPEYSGYCEANGQPDGCYFSAKCPAYVRGDAKLPTPTINFKSGSIKATMIDIDEQGPDGKWRIKPQYEEKFGPLLRKARPQRARTASDAVPTAYAISAALREALKIS